MFSSINSHPPRITFCIRFSELKIHTHTHTCPPKNFCPLACHTHFSHHFSLLSLPMCYSNAMKTVIIYHIAICFPIWKKNKTQAIDERRAFALLATAIYLCSARRTCGMSSKSILQRAFVSKQSQWNDWRSTKRRHWRKVRRNLIKK